MKICFFAKVTNPKQLEIVDFYKQDIEILKALGHEICIATKYKDIKRNCDIYYIWWWTWAFLPMFKTLFSKKYIITGTFNYENPENSYSSRPLYQKLLIRLALKRAHANVFVSKYELELVKSNLHPRNPLYSPHIIDTQLFCPSNETKGDFMLNIAYSHKGNAERKCLNEIIYAYSKIHKIHPAVRLVMAGMKGDHWETLVQIAKNEGVSEYVDFTGEISVEKKIELLQTCKIFIQPTVFEGFGLAIVEAMSCGAVVLTSKVGALPEVVEDAGIFADGRNISEIAEKSADILSNYEKYSEYGRKAGELVEKKYKKIVRRTDIETILQNIK